ncbi:hypothetical protein [Aeromonas hydrophila]|uniref:AbiTii domain-containing protein n=1 Tax=Aeromonas hydrophila TaxID=644 RepID=UPI003EC8EBCA
MPALIPELITMASNPAVKTPDLLRKAMVAARLLKQPEWATWIGYELQGYPNDIELPPYRVIRCELKARNPFRGLIPIIISHPEYAEAVSTCRIGQSISGLEDAAIPGKNVSFALSPEMMAMLMQDLNLDMEPMRVVGGNQLRALIDAVRNKLLTWALDLNEAGIQGDGMSFTPQEQQQAQLVPSMSINIGGNATGVQVQLNSPGGHQQQTVTSEQKAEALAALLPWLQQVLTQGQLQGEACAELQAELDTLKAQAASPNPKWPVIGAVACSVRAVLEGAGGGVLATQALGWLATLSGS